MPEQPADFSESNFVAANWPPADDAIGEALHAAWRDGSWGRYDGPHGQRLISAIAEQFQVEHVMPVSSGTIAVQVALRGLDIGPGDEVILAGYDYPGNFRAIEALGARPVLVDVAAGGATLDAAPLDQARSPATRCVVVSHLHGRLAPMMEICAWGAQHQVAVLEDACQAPGATIGNRPAGSWGDAAVLSFGGSKLLTAGRGGAVLTRRAEVAQRVRVACFQGNHAYPLSELQAAVLLPQLARLAERHTQRRAGAAQFVAALGDLPMLRPLAPGAAEDDPAYYKLGFLFMPGESAAVSREALIAAAQRRGVPIDAGFKGFVHRTARRCRHVGELANSKTAAEQLLVMHHPLLLESADSIEQAAEALRQACLELAAS